MQDQLQTLQKLPPVDDGSPCARDLEIYSLVIRGYSQVKIAVRFQLTQARVSQICHAVDQHLYPIHMERIRDIKSRQTARLEFIYQQAMKAWRKSQKVKTTVVESEKTTSAGQFPGDTSISQRTKEEQVGSAQFLSEARAALTDIRKVWGIEKLTAIEPEKPPEEDTFSFQGMKREDAIRLYTQLKIKKLQRKLEAMPGGNAETSFAQ